MTKKCEKNGQFQIELWCSQSWESLAEFPALWLAGENYDVMRASKASWVYTAVQLFARRAREGVYLSCAWGLTFETSDSDFSDLLNEFFHMIHMIWIKKFFEKKSNLESYFEVPHIKWPFYAISGWENFLRSNIFSAFRLFLGENFFRIKNSLGWQNF